MSRPYLSSRLTILKYAVQITCLNQLEVNTNRAEKFLTFKESLSKALYPCTYMDIDTLLSSKTGLFLAPNVRSESLYHLFKTSFFQT